MSVVTVVLTTWKHNLGNLFVFRSKEVIEIYKSVYHLRQQLFSLKEELEIKKSSSMDIHYEHSSSEHSEEEDISPLQQQVSGTSQ